jgi:prolyl-tRNA editing enzyme YbaK/EbsC (Cys-tRNA(Pro) deacylase)
LLAQVGGLDKPKMASPVVVLERTGFPAGGVSPVGHATSFPVFIDEAVMELEFAYGGGGAEEMLLRLRPTDIVALTGGVIVALTERDY